MPLKLYIATMFLLHGLSPLPVVAFGFMIAAAGLLVAMMDRRRWVQEFRFRLDDPLFAAIYLLGLLPMLFNPNEIGLQNLIHSVLWISAWTVSFWWIREWLIASRLRFYDVSAAAALGASLLSCAVILEFALANTTGRYLSDFVYFSIDAFPQATVFDDALLRPRGFSSEAGFTSIVFECLVPLSFVWLREGRWRRYLFPALVVPAYFLLFSAASISCLVLALLIFASLNWGIGRAVVIGSLAAALVTVLALGSEDVLFVLYEVILRKYLEFSPDEIATHEFSFSRPEAYVLGLNILAERPFGIGWGGVSQHMASGIPLLGVQLKGSGLISYPLEIGACAGIAGLLLYVAILRRKLGRLIQMRTLASQSTLFALLWVALHHVVVLEFWFPMLWFCLALSDTLVVARSSKGATATPASLPSGGSKTTAPYTQWQRS